MLLRYENQKTKQITECGEPPPRESHHRMDTKCMELYLMRNHPKVIQIFALTTVLDGDEDTKSIASSPKKIHS